MKVTMTLSSFFLLAGISGYVYHSHSSDESSNYREIASALPLQTSPALERVRRTREELQSRVEQQQGQADRPESEQQADQQRAELQEIIQNAQQQVLDAADAAQQEVQQQAQRDAILLEKQALQEVIIELEYQACLANERVSVLEESLSEQIEETNNILDGLRDIISSHQREDRENRENRQSREDRNTGKKKVSHHDNHFQFQQQQMFQNFMSQQMLMMSLMSSPFSPIFQMPQQNLMAFNPIDSYYSPSQQLWQPQVYYNSQRSLLPSFLQQDMPTDLNYYQLTPQNINQTRYDLFPHLQRGPSSQQIENSWYGQGTHQIHRQAPLKPQQLP